MRAATETAYYQLVLDEALAAINAENLQNLERVLKVTQVSYSANQVTQTDFISAEFDLAQPGNCGFSTARTHCERRNQPKSDSQSPARARRSISIACSASTPSLLPLGGSSIGAPGVRQETSRRRSPSVIPTPRSDLPGWSICPITRSVTSSTIT